MPRIQVGEREVAYDDPWADEPERLPVVCVHGSSFGRGTWQPCLPWIGALGWYRPVALDQPGHGASSGPACTSVAELGTHLGAFVDALDLPRPFALVGHSLGGAVAQWYQRARPGDVVALGLVSTTPQFTVPPDTLDTWKAAGREFSDERLDAIVAPTASRDVRMHVLGARAETSVEALHGDLDAIAGWDNPEWLTISVPTLVITADADTASIQEYARLWVAGLVHGTLASISQAGHMMPIEQPEATARAIVEWLDAVVPRGAGGSA
ncbi:MAG: alpha/beta hydrolase [Acidimicrobiia bacterium]|jgi:pimeloyl-ACP methyl ester carboxylesterase